MRGNWVGNLNCFMNSCQFSKSRNDFTNSEFRIFFMFRTTKVPNYYLIRCIFWAWDNANPNCFVCKNLFSFKCIKSISTWFYVLRDIREKSLDNILKHYVIVPSWKRSRVCFSKELRKPDEQDQKILSVS